MENKWITKLEEDTSPKDLLDKMPDAMQNIVEGTDMDERTRQVFDLVGIPYYPLVIVGGILVPLIVSSIMGFFLSSKY